MRSAFTMTRRNIVSGVLLVLGVAFGAVVSLAAIAPAEGARARTIPAGQSAAVLSAAASQDQDPATESPAEGLAIDRYDVQLDLQEDGAYEIVERLVFSLEGGTFSFGSRAIPTRRLDRITDLQASSPDLAGLESRVESANGHRVIRWEHEPSPGGGTVELRYRVEGALFDRGDTNEIFWAAVGSDVGLPVRAVEVQVTLPGEFADEPGELDIDPDADVRLDGDRWVLDFSHGALDEGQAWQLRVGFPLQLEGRRTGLRSTEAQVGILGAILLLLGLGVGLRGRERWVRGPVDEGAERPDTSLVEAAVLLHSGPYAEVALPATVIDLARRGHLTLVRDTPGDEDADPDRPESRMRLHPLESDPVSEFERAVLRDLEPYDTLEEFGEEAGDLRTERIEAVRARMIDEGWFVDLSQERRTDMWRGLTLLSVAAVLPVAVVVLGASPWLIAVAMGGLGLALGLIVRGEQRTVPTPDARRVQARLRGWLHDVHADLERRLEHEPVHAAQRYIESLPWLMIDPQHHHHGALADRLRKELEDTSEDFPVPGWIEDRWEERAEVREELDQHSAAYAAFHSTSETALIASSAMVPLLIAPGSSVAASASVSAAGAAGAGAAGGGGVSAG